MIFGLTKKNLDEERAEFDRKLRNTEKWADELRKSLEEKIHDIGERDAEIEKLKAKTDDISRSLREAKEENEELRMQIAVLHKYYFEGREPSEAEVYDIRRDLRVHGLELENMKLERTVEDLKASNSRMNHEELTAALDRLATLNTAWQMPMIPYVKRW